MRTATNSIETTQRPLTPDERFFIEVMADHYEERAQAHPDISWLKREVFLRRQMLKNNSITTIQKD